MSIETRRYMIVTCDVCGKAHPLWSETKDRAREYLLWNEQWAHDKKRDFDQCGECSKEPALLPQVN